MARATAKAAPEFHPQQPGLGQRVARQRLHGDSREGEARPDDDGQRRARHARLPDDDGLGDLPPVPSGGGQPAPHFAERERFGSDGDADHGQPGEHGQACDPDGDGAPAPEGAVVSRRRLVHRRSVGSGRRVCRLAGRDRDRLLPLAGRLASAGRSAVIGRSADGGSSAPHAA